MEHRELLVAVSTATAAAAQAAATAQRTPPENILTPHNIDFDMMLAQDEIYIVSMLNGEMVLRN
ncbi:hypothetical protein F442_15639 [Phytophthora nicotianae P10297]|uniref:Uncharacterized protein n=1 Tax=Phytophthora nicotianae P10297 TaxID=1317064 RepID=W2YN08_PHYNI|nr:hypothetical protein F442_15639 [Phytophthora nicotianae P10297]